MSRDFLLHKMNGGFIPVFLIHPAAVAIQVQLVKAESDQEILRLPLLFIRILVLHPDLPHHAAASGIVDIVRGRDIGQPVPLYLCGDGPSGLGGDSLMLEFRAQAIAEIVGLGHIYLDISDGSVAALQADGVGIGLWLRVKGCVAVFKEFSGLIHALQGKPGQKPVHIRIAVYLIQGLQAELQHDRR